MKGNIRIVFFLCIGLLICVLIGQGGWLYKTRKMEINRFRQEAGDRLGDSFKEFLDEEWMTRKVPFSYGLKEDKKTFVYGDSCRVREITLSFAYAGTLLLSVSDSTINMFFPWETSLYRPGFPEIDKIVFNIVCSIFY